LRRGERNIVYRARASGQDLGPGCYAIKTVREAGDAIATAMLRREAHVASEVVHAHLIAVLAAEHAASRRYLVMPYLEGITLRRWLEHAVEQFMPPMPVATALCMVRQVAAALAALHQAGWLHGQARPEHILVAPQGHATLIDLTQTRRLDSSECDLGSDLTHLPVYAAPESFSSRGRLTTAADTYSLGVVLYELVTGQPPFVTLDARQLAAMHRSAAPPELRQIRPKASLETSELVRRMLAKEPRRRPSDDELLRWLAEIEIAELEPHAFAAVGQIEQVHRVHDLQGFALEPRLASDL